MERTNMYIEESLKYKEPCNTCNYRLTQPDGPFCGKCVNADSNAGANVPLDRLVSTDKHPDLIAWEKEHNKPLHLGCKVTILETCEYFDADYDRGKTFIVVMMFVDSGGLNMGLNDGQNENYLCETDGYYIADLVPA